MREGGKEEEGNSRSVPPSSLIRARNDGLRPLLGVSRHLRRRPVKIGLVDGLIGRAVGGRSSHGSSDERRRREESEVLR